MEEELENNFFPYLETKEASCWNNNQKGAIADFMYNSGQYTKHNETGLSFNYYVQTCNYDEVLGYMDYWLYAGGLYNRKKAERELFLLN